jgi:hypothetical protein
MIVTTDCIMEYCRMTGIDRAPLGLDIYERAIYTSRERIGYKHGKVVNSFNSFTPMSESPRISLTTLLR